MPLHCRLSLREYHTPENIDEITDNPSYQPTILEKLNHREQKTYCRPSREPYLNTYIEKLRQEITDRTVHNRRFQRNNLSKRERLALDRLSNNRDNYKTCRQGWSYSYSKHNRLPTGGETPTR